MSPVSYDEVPYRSYAFSQTYPDRLATVAALFGVKAPPVECCRVLELGCASGGNLLPLAHDFSNSTFVGIDLSPRQVDDGQRAVRELGPKHLELRALSILASAEARGRSDYLTCHGVSSWVPAEVQEKILSICRHSLTDNGIAYVSYNTYPGWRLRTVVRDMMVYYASPITNPTAKASRARAVLDFL